MRHRSVSRSTGGATVRLLFRVVGVSALLLWSAPAAAQDWFPPDSSLQATLQEIVRDSRAAGIVVGLLDADGSRRVVAFGSPGPDALPLDRESVFEIGSITKVFTGVLLAEMVRRGEVQFSEPIAHLLPSPVKVPTRNGKAITLLDIATHHSGLPRMPTNFAPRDPDNPYADYTVKQMYEFLSGYELTRDPGDAFEYSNYAMGLLGYALALRAGLTYEELLAERVLRPLDMTHSAITLTPWMERHLVHGHGRFGEPVPNWDIPTLAGAGALRSTVDDMLAFAAANLSPQQSVLLQALSDTHRPRRQLGESSDSIGLNWIITRDGERTLTWHNGGTAGYRTFLGLDLEARRAVVVLTNTGGYGVDDLGFHLLDPAVPPQPPPVGPVIASTYRAEGVEAAVARYRSLRQTAEDRYRFSESQLDRLGYWLLRQDRVDDAIVLFRLNVEAHADSANPYDSLGDGLSAAGRLEEARDAYARAVALAEEQNDSRLAEFRRNLRRITRQLRRHH